MRNSWRTSADGSRTGAAPQTTEPWGGSSASLWRGSRTAQAESYLMVSSISAYFSCVMWLSFQATKPSVPSPFWHRCRSLRCCHLYNLCCPCFSLSHAPSVYSEGPWVSVMPRGQTSEPRVMLRVMLPLTQPEPLPSQLQTLLGEGVRLKMVLLPLERGECGYFSIRVTCRGQVHFCN